MERLLERAGVPYRTYLSHTKRLLVALETPPASRERPRAAAPVRPRARGRA